MEKKITITYRWWKDDRKDKKQIKPTHQEALEESAMERINSLMKEGYTSGELNDNITMDDEDGNDGVSYTGWWEMTTETIN